jgi:hypothetical protein
MKIKLLFHSSRQCLCFGAAFLLVCLAVAFILYPLNAAGQHPAVPKLTLAQVEQLVSSKVPDSTLSSQIQRRGLAFKPSAADLDALRAKGAGPLTIAAVEALLPNTALGARPNKISATTDPSGAFISLLEQNWNWQSHWRVFLGPTYFGSATSFGRGAMGTLRYSLAETSEYPVFRALASKGLITLSELSIADAPTSPAPGVYLKIDLGAIVNLTAAGVRSGKVDEKEHNVTFAFGTYGVEKITSNTRVRISEDDYRLVEGTYVLNIAPKFDDVWGERGWPRNRDFQFRALFKYDSAESKWEIAYASAGHGERAMDTGPRGGNFESEKVPQTVNQLRMTHSGATSLAPYFGVWNKSGFHGGYVKVIISGNPEKPRVHLWGAASPQDTDDGEEDAIWDGSALTATFQQDGRPTVYRFTLDQNANLQLNCHYLRRNGTEASCVTMSYTR